MKFLLAYIIFSLAILQLCQALKKVRWADEHAGELAKVKLYNPNIPPLTPKELEVKELIDDWQSKKKDGKAASNSAGPTAAKASHELTKVKLHNPYLRPRTPKELEAKQAIDAWQSKMKDGKAASSSAGPTATKARK
jgi:hypothetical protein